MAHKNKRITTSVVKKVDKLKSETGEIVNHLNGQPQRKYRKPPARKHNQRIAHFSIAKNAVDDEFYTLKNDVKKIMLSIFNSLPNAKNLKYLFPCDSDDSEFVKFAKETGLNFKNMAGDYRKAIEDFGEWCDIIITNPPFSIYSDYLKTVLETGKLYTNLCGLLRADNILEITEINKKRGYFSNFKITNFGHPVHEVVTAPTLVFSNFKIIKIEEEKEEVKEVCFLGGQLAKNAEIRTLKSGNIMCFPITILASEYFDCEKFYILKKHMHEKAEKPTFRRLAICLRGEEEKVHDKLKKLETLLRVCPEFEKIKILERFNSTRHL